MYTKGLVSVIIPSYNHGQWIGEAIESVISQTYKNMELIIIDDFSLDDSLVTIKKYAEKYDFIQVLTNEKNEGACYSHNKALTKAKGEFVAILNSDDIWYHNKLEMQINFLNNNLDIAAVFTLLDSVNAKGEILNRPDFTAWFERENRNKFQWIRHFIDVGNCLAHPSVLARQSALQELCEYVKYPLKQMADFELWHRLCIKYDIHILPYKLLAFRIHSYNESMNMGNNEHTLLHTENIYALNNLKEIKSVNDLIKIFPEHESLMKIHNPLLIPFYLAQIISFDNVPYKNIWSTLELYNCFADPEIAKLIRENNLMSLKELYNIAINKDIVHIKLNQSHANLNNKISELEQHNLNLNNKISELEQHNLNLNNKLYDMEQHNLNLNNELYDMELKFSQVIHSRSWKLMHPYRLAGRIFKKFINKLR